MPKIITSFFIVLLLGLQTTFASTDLPNKSVTAEPIIAVVDANIVIHALVYNNQKETVTVIVEFKANDKSLGKQTATITALSAKTLSIDWKQPKEPTEVFATVVSALNKQKKEIKILEGPLGSVIVGSPETKSLLGISLPKGKSGSFLAGVFSGLEVFRKDQQIRFAKLRDETRNKLGIEIKDAIVDNLKAPFSVTSPAPISIAGVDEPAPVVAKKFDNPMDYVTLIFSTALASLFANQMMFYIVSILLLLFIIRFLFKMFV